jgi:peptide/nickel transport system permease protein
MATESTTTLPPKAAPEVVSKDEKEAKVFVASQWQLMWWKFRKHKIAMVGGVVTLLFYLVAAFCEFLAPYYSESFWSQYTYAPPAKVYWFDYNESGGLSFKPFVYGYNIRTDPVALRRIFTVDMQTKIHLGLFVRGQEYKLWGLIPSNLHLIGPVEAEAPPFFLIGADRLGRDMFSRIIYGTRISLSIGLVGVAFSLVMGVVLGGISGYFGGTIDNIIQRIIEFLRSIPTIPLWLGLSAALPKEWGPLQVYFGITIILSLVGWTGMARVVRGKFFSLRTEDFVVAARLDGSSQMRIIVRHMVPSFMSHIIASITASIPGMIISETSLSFLGLGLRPPVVSWGVLLQEAQNIRSVATAPWLLLPGVAVIVVVLAMSFLGDGLRDAADPYGV